MNDDDLTGQVLQAYKVAESAHRGQRRFSDEPYINHCLATLRILEAMGIEDSEMLMAALLHDVVEDAKITLDQITNLFGTNVSFIVDGVSQFEAQDITHDKPLDLDKESLIACPAKAVSAANTAACSSADNSKIACSNSASDMASPVEQPAIRNIDIINNVIKINFFI